MPPPSTLAKNERFLSIFGRRYPFSASQIAISAQQHDRPIQNFDRPTQQKRTFEILKNQPNVETIQRNIEQFNQKSNPRFARSIDGVEGNCAQRHQQNRPRNHPNNGYSQLNKIRRLAKKRQEKRRRNIDNYDKNDRNRKANPHNSVQQRNDRRSLILPDYIAQHRVRR